MTTVRVRAGDSDRQAAVDLLTVHFTDGRLDAGEYDDRVRNAYAAVYVDDLPAMFADLPGGFGQPAGQAGTARADRGGPPWAARAAGPPWAATRPGGGDRRPGRPPVRPRPGMIVAAAILAVLAVISFVAFVGLFFWPLVWVGIAILLFSRGGCARRRTAGARSGTSPGPGWHGKH